MPKLSTIENELENLPKDFLASLILDRKSYSEMHSKMMNYFLGKENASVIYITLDKPGKTIKENLIRNKINTDNLYFIDLITEASGVKLEASNFLFSGSPTNLTELSITINSAMKNLKTQNKFILFDTLSTLFNYNPQQIALKFIHYLSTAMRSLEVSGVFIIIKNQLDERILSFISGFVDKTIEV